MLLSTGVIVSRRLTSSTFQYMFLLIPGESFVTLKEDMKKVYAPYCRNHDDVIAMLEKVSLYLFWCGGIC